MRTRIRSVGIAIGVLLALLLLPSARADSFNFSFTANQSQCPNWGLSACPDSGSGTFTTNPITFSPLYYHVYPVTAVNGMLDGIFPTSIVVHDYFGAIPGPGSAIWYMSGPISFTANGQQWAFTRQDQGPWRDFLYNYGTGAWEPINLTITAPEPSTLLFLGIGLVGVMGLTLLKNRFS